MAKEIKVKASWKDDVSPGTKKMAANVKKELKKVDQSIKKTETSSFNLKNAFIALGGVVVFRKLIGGIAGAAKAASDLEEATSKFNVVFKGVETQAARMREELVGAYFFSRTEANKFLSEIQDLLVPMGLNANAAADMSGEIVRLAADLASFNNLPTQDVMRDIQSALVGNFETTKKYGVILNETIIKQRAFNDGLFSGKGVIDASVKAQLALKIITEASAAALGDRIRTADGFANSMVALNSSWENFSAALGQFVINSPAVKAALSFLTNSLKEMSEALFFTRDKAKAKIATEILNTKLQEIKDLQIAIDALKAAKPGEASNLFGLGAEDLGTQEKIDKLLRVRRAELAILTDQTNAFAEALGQSNEVTKTATISDADFNKSISEGMQLSQDRMVLRQGLLDFQIEMDVKEVESRNKLLSDMQQIGLKIDLMDEEATQKLRAQFLARAQITAGFAAQLGQALAAGAFKGAEGAKESFKAILITTLNFLEQMLLAQKVAALADPKNIAIPGFVFKNLAQVAITAAAFGAVKAGINSFQFGTVGAPGGRSLVGERGPEIVDLPRGARVKSTGETNNFTGDKTININTTVSSEEIIGALMQAEHDGKLHDFKIKIADDILA